MCKKEKPKMCKFLLTGCMEIICKNFFAELVHSVFICFRLSKNLTAESGSKQWFSLLQCAWGLRQLVFKPGFRPKGRVLGIYEKSENFNSLRPILIELCKKKLQGGGQIDPPAGIGLRIESHFWEKRDAQPPNVSCLHPPGFCRFLVVLKYL